MLQPKVIRHAQARRLSTFVRLAPALLLWLSIFGLTTHAQANFVSGSTGADGAFSPTQSQTLQLPESGVFNFTTVNIPAGVTIRFARNARNTPVTILAQGNVTVAGTIDVSGSSGGNTGGGLGGPGGFNGGGGGPQTRFIAETSQYPYSPGVNGDGPGGGSGGGSAATPDSSGTAGGGGFAFPGSPGESQAVVVGVTNAAGGPKYGLPTLLPLIGGSGGGGETGSSSPGLGGGGGGGAVLIASSGTINFITDPATTNNLDHRINASGGEGYCVSTICTANAGSGGGSGGAVRLVANVISGELRVQAAGGAPSGTFRTTGGFGGGGYVRIEAYNMNSLNVTLSHTYPISSPRVTRGTPGVVTPPALPTIRIVSVAGVAPPNQPNGSLQGGPDIVLPANQPNPVSVALAASNIKPGTLLQVTLTPENGARVVAQSTPLAGTASASTASASIALPDGLCVIQASATIDVVGTPLVASNGERVKQIEVNAVYGGTSTVTYVTESGKRIPAGR